MSDEHDSAAPDPEPTRFADEDTAEDTVEDTRPPEWDRVGAAAATPRGSERRRRSSRMLARKYSKSKEKVRVLQRVVGALVGVILLSWGALLYAMVAHDEEVESLESQIDLAEVRAHRLADSVHAQKAELEALMQGRIPALRSIEFGTPMRLDQGYVRSVLFRWGEARKTPRIEYELVLTNADRDYLVPELELVLFDRRGFEIDVIPIKPDRGGYTSRDLALARGDVRTLNGGIDLSADARPAHFLIEMNGQRLFAPPEPESHASIR